MTEHEIGLVIAENRAFIERTAWHVVCVVNVGFGHDEKRRITADEVGTGTACKFKDHDLTLTAEHVIESAMQDKTSHVGGKSPNRWRSHRVPELSRTI